MVSFDLSARTSDEAICNYLGEFDGWHKPWHNPAIPSVVNLTELSCESLRLYDIAPSGTAWIGYANPTSRSDGRQDLDLGAVGVTDGHCQIS